MHETEFITVVIHDNPTPRKAFRCVNCGKIVFEYNGDVKLLIMGDNEESAQRIIQCRNRQEKVDCFNHRYFEPCHTKYVISAA